MEAIVVAIIGVVGTLGTAIFAYLSKKKEIHASRKLKQAELEINIQRSNLDFSEFFSNWGEIVQELRTLMKETEIDRFLMFKAWNGVLDPRWTTAVYQIRQGSQEPISYVHFELDVDYQNRLRTIYEKKKLYFEVSDLPPSAIKEVYEVEGVTSALWYLLDTKNLEETESKSIIYCSFASHNPEGMSEATKTKCKIIADRLKSITESF